MIHSPPVPPIACLAIIASSSVIVARPTTGSVYAHEGIIADESAATTEAQSPLALARNLHVPLANDVLNAEFEHSSFWEENGPLLLDAWKEWEEDLARNAPRGDDVCDDGIVTDELSVAIEDAFSDPSEETESIVKSLWTSPHSNDDRPPRGVYAVQLLTPSGISRIRNLLDLAISSGIPTRRPNGMNRHGVIVDPNVYGAVSMKSLIALIEGQIVDRIVRPVGRMLFPDRIGCGDDVEYFAFTIRYNGGVGEEHHVDRDMRVDGNGERIACNVFDVDGPCHDVELKEHRDASIVTLNVNLNLPEKDERYDGSEVFFRELHGKDRRDPSIHGGGRGDDVGTVRFSPGMAIIHLGAHRHGSLPISTPHGEKGTDNGKRYNLVIWLFGADGDVRIAPYEKEDQMNVMQRWHGCNHTKEYVFGL
jgi:hypothetical protein